MIQTLWKLGYLLTRRQKWQAAGLFLLMVGGSALEIVGVGSIPAFVSILGEPETLLKYDLVRRIHDGLGIADHREFVVWFAGGMALFFVLKNAFFVGLSLVRAVYTHRSGAALANRLFRAYLHSPYTFHLQRNTAEVLRNVQGESKNVVEHVLVPGLNFVLEVLVLAGLFALLIVAAPIVSLSAFGALGLVSGLFYVFVRRRLVEHGARSQRYQGEMIQTIQEGLGGVKMTKLLGREEYFSAKHYTSARGHAHASVVRQISSDTPRLLIETTAVAALLLISLTFVARDRPLGEILPLLTLFAVASVRLVPSFNRITMAVNQMRYGHASIGVVYDDLRALERLPRDTVAPSTGAVRLTSSISLVGLRYRYPEAEEEALTDVNLTIEHGSAVAFVGPSGAGKTTVINVLLGLLEPTSGSVRVDGVDIRKDLRGWQSQIGYVPQGTYLTDSTIRRNVAFGVEDDDIDEEAVRRAIRSAQLETLVERLPHGLDSVVGEGGLRLSGGQRQRIGIARALYHDPRVLVMDEPTSDLDAETERRILEAVEGLRGERTIIVVAHRISTVRNCDELFYLHDGRLEASGSYDELLESSEGFRAIAAG